MEHRASGPISPEELQRIAELPYGQAQRELRKHDPMYGVKPGDKIKFTVELVTHARLRAYTTVEAESEEEAMKIAEKISPHNLDFEYDGDGRDDVEAVSASPSTPL